MRMNLEKSENGSKSSNIDSNGTATFHAFDRIPEKYIEHEIILVLIGKLVTSLFYLCTVETRSLNDRFVI